MCGAPRRWNSNGSPPLARRGLKRGEGAEASGRFTSARAERTPWGLWPILSWAVHLRSRGEDFGVAGDDLADGGSPPLARRGRVTWLESPGLDRFTSARAERTPSPAAPWTARPVHLRSRGEDQLLRVVALDQCGSPPLARRGRPRLVAARRIRRFTSARAERTSAEPSRIMSSAVHLRSRGEDTSRPAILCGLCGFFTRCAKCNECQAVEIHRSTSARSGCVEFEALFVVAGVG